MKRISFLIIIFVFLPFAQAREWFEMYNNARTNAMGGAKIAVTSDDTSIFRNPAGLGSFRGVYVNVFDPEIEFSQYLQNDFISNTTNISKVKDFIVANPDKYYHGKMQVTPTLSLRHFSFGLIYRDEISAVASTDSSTAMDTLYQNDIGVFAALNYSLWEGRIKLGVTGKAISRIEIDNLSLDMNGSMDLGTIGSEGMGTGFDAGLTLQAPIIYLPTLSVVARDIGDLNFASPGLRSVSTTRPQVVKQSVDVGFSLNPIYSKDFRGVFALEYSDATDSRLEEFQAKRIHIGMELIWRDVLYVRLGSNQSYWTAGFEIASERLSWQIATFGEEVGTVDAPREDRRWSTRIGIRF